MTAERYPLGPDWQAIAKMLYEAVGQLEGDYPGGFDHGIDRRCPLLQPAIDAYEYATDAIVAAGDTP